MKVKVKIGLVGVGNMGGSIVQAIIKDKKVPSRDIFIYDKMRSKITSFRKKWGVKGAASLEELLKNTNLIFLAVKPQDLAIVAEDIKPHLRSGQTVASILAGTPLKKLQKHFGRKADIVRVMPNLGATVFEGMSAIAGKNSKGLRLTEALLKSCGETVVLPEKHFDLVTAISGSGPAYFFLLMECLIKAGVQKGLSEKVASLLTIQTAKGAALLAQESPFTPEQLRVMVTSKKGTTDAALKVFKSKQFSKMVLQAVNAAAKRGQELSRG